jgi:hypothetical protein
MARTAAGKKPKPAKTPKKKAKPAKVAKPAKERRQRMSENKINKEDQRLFLSHLELIAVARGKISKATNDIRRLYKTAKSDGFIKDDFDTAFSLQGEGGELTQKNKIARKVTIARYLGLQLGETLDLFLDQGVEEQPPEQRAFDAGKQDALENKKPDATGFDEQQYLKGFHSVSEKRINEGIKKAEPAKPLKPPSAAVKAAADKAQERAQRKAAQSQSKSPEQEKSSQQRAQDAQAFEKPTSGLPITRSQFNAMNGTGAEPEDDEPSMFQRRQPEAAE